MGHSVSALNRRCQARLPSYDGKLTYMTTVGDRIKSRREKLRLSQLALAKDIGVKRASVSQWESGATKNITAENLIHCARKLKTTVEWLWLGEGPEERGAPPNATIASEPKAINESAQTEAAQIQEPPSTLKQAQQEWAQIIERLTPEQRQVLKQVAGQFAIANPERRAHEGGPSKRQTYYSPLMSDPAFGRATKSKIGQFGTKSRQNDKENNPGEESGKEKKK